jgi:hypothetical protein
MRTGMRFTWLAGELQALGVTMAAFCTVGKGKQRSSSGRTHNSARYFASRRKRAVASIAIVAKYMDECSNFTELKRPR